MADYKFYVTHFLQLKKQAQGNKKTQANPQTKSKAKRKHAV